MNNPSSHPFVAAPRPAPAAASASFSSALPLAGALVGAVFAGNAHAQSPFTEATAAISRVGQTILPEAADFDGDGNLDVIMQTAPDRGLAVFKGLGGGAFDVPFRIDPGPPSVGSYTLGDVDGDGDPDIVINPRDSSMPIRLVTSSPSGFTTQALALPAGHTAGQLADMNGDGALDLVTSRSNGVDLDYAWFENVGGTFPGSAQFIATGAFGIFEAEDFDGDGRIDLATPATNGTLRVSFGLGAGAFAPPALLSGPAGSAMFPLSLKDVNGDGLVDIFQARGSGLLHFQATGPRVYAAPVPLTSSLDFENTTLFIDIDADGDLDVVNASYLPFDPSTVTVFEQVTPGVFGPAVPNAAAPFKGVAAGDLNGDGREDLIFDTVDGLQWQVGGLTATEGFFGEVNSENDAISLVTAHSVTDLDSDGDLDILVGSRDERSLGWIDNLGGGQLAPVRILRNSNNGPLFIRPVDFDGDGDTDIVQVTKTGSNSELEVLINDGAETFALQGGPMTLPNAAFVDAQVKDFNADGLIDLLITSGSSSLNNRATADLLLGMAGGGFAPLSNVVDGSPMANLIQTADLNGDGLPDIVRDGGTFSGPRQLFVSLNQGGGTFAPAVLQAGSLPDSAASITLKDFDSDGFIDVIVKPFSAVPILYRGNGTDTLELPISLQMATSFGAMDLADIDSDGDLDLFSSVGSLGTTLVYSEQLPGGTFAAPVPLVPGNDFDILSVIMADLDGDGDPEAVVLRDGNVSDAPIQVYDNGTLGAIGQGFCDGQTPNSTGAAGTLTAFGSELTSLNRIELSAAQLPASQFAMLLGSRTFGPPMPLGTSPGLLCLAGNIGRYQGPGQIMNSGAAGAVVYSLDLTALSLPNGTVMGLPGESWSFQAWHRDTLAGVATSQLTTGVSVTLR